MNDHLRQDEIDARGRDPIIDRLTERLAHERMTIARFQRAAEAKGFTSPDAAIAGREIVDNEVSAADMAWAVKAMKDHESTDSYKRSQECEANGHQWEGPLKSVYEHRRLPIYLCTHCGTSGEAWQYTLGEGPRG